MTEFDKYDAASQTANVGMAQDKVHTITDEFSFALDDLRNVLSELTIRLQPVLRPHGPENTGGGDPMPPVSEIRDRLYSLHAASGEVRRILDRLDV